MKILWQAASELISAFSSSCTVLFPIQFQFEIRANDVSQGLTSAENSAKRLFKLLASSGRTKYKYKNETPTRKKGTENMYKIKLNYFRSIFACCFHSISCLSIWFIIFRLYLEILRDLFIFCRLPPTQSESCFPCCVAIAQLSSYFHSSFSTHCLLWRRQPYVFCFGKRDPYTIRRHTPAVLYIVYRFRFCLCTDIFCFRIYLFIYFFDRADNEISGQCIDTSKTSVGLQKGWQYGNLYVLTITLYPHHFDNSIDKNKRNKCG